MGTLVGTLVGALVGPLLGTLVDPIVGSNFAVRVLCASPIGGAGVALEVLEVLREMYFRKRVTLHGGVAATLTPIALHCATKGLKLPITLLKFRTIQYSPCAPAEARRRISGGFFTGKVCRNFAGFSWAHQIKAPKCRGNVCSIFCKKIHSSTKAFRGKIRSADASP